MGHFIITLILTMVVNGQLVKLEVFRNGASDNGQHLDIDATEFSGERAGSLREHVARLLEEPEVARLVLGNGMDLSLEHVAQHAPDERTRVYAVTPGNHFVWPFVHYRFAQTVTLADGSQVEMVSVSDKPRVFHLRGFFQQQEADQLIENVEKIQDPDHRMQRSTVGAERGKTAKVDSTRTSSNAWDTNSQTSLTLQRRCFDLLRMQYDVSKADGLQILRYEPGEAYQAHSDAFPVGEDKEHDYDPKTGSNRFATIFMYLSEPEQGGQTVFPNAPIVPPEFSGNGTIPPHDFAVVDGSWQDRLLHTCYEKLAVVPKNGTAVLFYSQDGHGHVDPLADHGACPPIKGVKIGANLWVWNSDRLQKKSDTRLSVTFVNGMSSSVDIFWENKLISTIASQEERVFNTFIGHEFSARSADQVVWSRRMSASDHDGRVVIGGDKEEL